MAILIAGLLLPTSLAYGDGAKTVAIYPLEAPNSELRIYSRPIATALAKGLRKGLGVKVTVSAKAGEAPTGTDLIIDGSILKSKRGISLEARVRDPSSGLQVGAASAKVRPLEDLERSAAELVTKLTPIASKWRATERVRAPVRLKGSLTEVKTEAPGETEPTDERERPPLFVIPRAGGIAAGGSVSVDKDATKATFAFADRLGARYATSEATGSDEPRTLANAVRDTGALYALAIHLRSVKYDFRGVLSARGRAVIRLIDRNGVVVMQKQVSTDTVVGSRGDRHTALVYKVTEQCLDIVLPDLRKALTR